MADKDSKNSKTSMTSEPDKASKPAASRTPKASKAENAATAAAVARALTSGMLTPALSRHKHWHYLASYQGSWLTTSRENLMAATMISHRSQRPHFVDDAVLVDLVRIRGLVDQAAELAVRAAADVVSAAPAPVHDANPYSLFSPDRPSDVASGRRGVRMSAERRHRIRVEAVQKLCAAYEIDEVAASIAAIQSLTALQDLPARVLERAPDNPHALYVHFFHEKVPGRDRIVATETAATVAATTTTTATTSTASTRPGKRVGNTTPAATRPDQLDRLLAAPTARNNPASIPILRTRAAANALRGDLDASIADLNEALRLNRSTTSAVHQHEHLRDDTIRKLREGEAVEMAAAAAFLGGKRKGKAGSSDSKRGDGGGPAAGAGADAVADAAIDTLPVPELGILSSLESQLLVQRANMYLAMGCQLVDFAVEPTGDETEPARRARGQAQKKLNLYARRAVRDFLAFLRPLGYSPNVPIEYAEDFTRRMVKTATNRQGVRQTDRTLQQGISRLRVVRDVLQTHVAARLSAGHARDEPLPDLRVRVHSVGDLFSDPGVAAALPPYPATALAGTADEQLSVSASSLMMSPLHLRRRPPAYITVEVVTFHPLLEDALHALLLAYCLLRTPPPVLARHANTVARLVRFADGYPAFQPAGCPGRVDWTSVLQAASGPDWLQLPVDWDAYCRPFSKAEYQEAQRQAERNANATATAATAATAALAAGVDGLRLDAAPKPRAPRPQLPIMSPRADAIVFWLAGDAKRRAKEAAMQRAAGAEAATTTTTTETETAGP